MENTLQYSLDDLNLDNFKNLVGRRFRMTQDQMSRGLSRPEALQEWITAQREQLSRTSLSDEG